jgi:hypothetical protein
MGIYNLIGIACREGVADEPNHHACSSAVYHAYPRTHALHILHQHNVEACCLMLAWTYS